MSLKEWICLWDLILWWTFIWKLPRFRLWDKTLKIVEAKILNLDIRDPQGRDFEWRHPRPLRSKFQMRHLRLSRTEFWVETFETLKVGVSNGDIRDPRGQNLNWDSWGRNLELRHSRPSRLGFRMETSETFEVEISTKTSKTLEDGILSWDIRDPKGQGFEWRHPDPQG